MARADEELERLGDDVSEHSVLSAGDGAHLTVEVSGNADLNRYEMRRDVQSVTGHGGLALLGDRDGAAPKPRNKKNRDRDSAVDLEGHGEGRSSRPRAHAPMGSRFL
jgi:hypothetical protein